MNKIIFTCFVLISFTSCTVSRFSNKQKDEETGIKVSEDETFVASSSAGQPLARGLKSRGLITASMLIQGASVGAEALKKFIDNEKKKYTAEYTDGISNLYFYSHLSEKNAWDPEGIQLKEFTFVRTFKNKKGSIDTAVKIIFVLDTTRSYEIYNNAVFKLKVKEVVINYAKAKVPTKKWFMPWTYLQKHRNDKLDMDIELDFTTTYNTEAGTINHNVDIGKFYFFIRDAPLDKKDPTYKNYYDSLAGISLDGYSFIVPRSFGHYYNGTEYKPCYSQGNYNITILVKESGKEKYIDKLIMDNSSIAIDAITDQVKKLK
ncbi:MAG: hypothetical protein ACKVQB_10655 [Bacteroidia bacterium]